jgi:hypothetical protein
MASFKDVAAALGLEPGATPDDAIAAVTKMRADAVESARVANEARAAAEASASEIEALEQLVREADDRCHKAEETARDAVESARVANEALGEKHPEPAEDGKRYFALVKIQAGEWGTFEPGEMLDPEHATKIVRGMTEGEQFRTE